MICLLVFFVPENKSCVNIKYKEARVFILVLTFHFLLQKNMEQIHHDQASADFYYLSELIRDYIGLVGAVKEAFQVSQNSR